MNGQYPESNGYLLDAEFRILTSNAPAEKGGTSGATTSVVT